MSFHTLKVNLPVTLKVEYEKKMEILLEFDILFIQEVDVKEPREE